MVESVTMLNYLGRTLDQTDNAWPELRRNMMRKRSVWKRLRTMIQREEADPRVSAMFYGAVAQEILLYVLETWVLSAAIKKKVEGAHTVFLSQIMVKRAQKILYRTWETPGAAVVREAAVTQS